ncbi:MAG TPA: VacJ family lipoprotein [Hyphomicrobiales bacterium]|nr:VacJ family lipoprotein [Hyphomicrobiales bacterium]
MSARKFQLLSLVVLLLSCLGTPIAQAQDDDDDFFVFDEEEGNAAPQIADPLEGFNRAMFAVNDKLYRYLLKPVARGLRVLPVPVRTGASNFFNNLVTPMSAASALLQGDLRNAGTESARFLLNTTAGLAGILDPATDVGLARDTEDLGQTLGRWGVGHGVYLVLPFVGSTSLREFPAQIANNAFNPLYQNLNDEQIMLINVADAEVALSLDQDSYEAFYRDALDPYIFFRSAWVQNRAGRVAR